MLTSSETAGHVPEETVQRNTLVPTISPVTEELAEVALTIVPEPETNVHKPPVAAVAAKVAVEEQIDWSLPANALTGLLSTVIVTSSTEEEQTPLLIVQRNTFTPADKPDTAVFAEVALTKVAVPETTVQTPEPTVGIFPESVVEVAHTC